MCELLVGLDNVTVTSVVRNFFTGRLRIEIESSTPPPACQGCGERRRLKDHNTVELVDLPAFGQPSILAWRKRRWKGCCGSQSMTEVDEQVAAAGQVMTARAGRWATVQVGRYRRSVASVAAELGCEWHTVNRAVISWGEALLNEDTGRVGRVTAVGLDETLFVRRGRWKRRSWATSIVDVDCGQLIDIVPGRTATAVIGWFDSQPVDWVQHITHGVLDLSGPYRKVFNDALDWVDQIADPFHVIRAANQRVDECRRRVQNDSLGHRGRKDDPLYRIRRLLTNAAENLDTAATKRLRARLAVGDPHGEVQWAWEAKEAIRDLYQITDHTTAVETIDHLAELMTDSVFPPEVNRLGQMLRQWRVQITNWHQRRLSNGPTEGANNMIKLAKRIGFGFRSFTNYRIRALLYAGRPNWNLLNTIQPAQNR